MAPSRALTTAVARPIAAAARRRAARWAAAAAMTAVGGEAAPAAVACHVYVSEGRDPIVMKELIASARGKLGGEEKRRRAPNSTMTSAARARVL